jgi:hypothetical protein
VVLDGLGVVAGAVEGALGLTDHVGLGDVTAGADDGGVRCPVVAGAAQPVPTASAITAAPHSRNRTAPPRTRNTSVRRPSARVGWPAVSAR